MALVLIVDDERYQRALIRETLATDSSLTFAEAGNGREALILAPSILPDVVVLDVMMPDMDGFEVCRTLKADAILCIVPVILVTALGQIQDKVMGLDSGADDFVNKPFEENELQARVRSALRVKALHDQLRQVNQMRDNLVKMIMHDMGNMVSVIGSALTLYEKLPPDSPRAIQFVRDAYDANVSLGEMINDALDIGRLEAQKMPLHRMDSDLQSLIQALVDSYQGPAFENRVQLTLEVDPSCNPVACIDTVLIRRVVGNLLTNALKYAPSGSSIAVKLHKSSQPEFLAFSVGDQGPGISPEELPMLFDKYEQAQHYVSKGSRPGHGLGLTFSKMAVEAHGGTIVVQSVLGKGATFLVELPQLIP
jgi:two-component system, sensor histidine kinase and response regulator